MIRKFKELLAGKSYPLNTISINQERVNYNYKTLSQLDDKVKIAPVLKSNAYGHGIEIIGNIVDLYNPPFICVDSLFEAYKLQKAGVNSKILIMGYVDPRSLIRKKLPFSYAIFDLEFARSLSRNQSGCEVHVFVGTGMSREGVPLAELEEFLNHLKEFKGLNIVGLMSHLSSANEPQSEHTTHQVENFRMAKQIALKVISDMKWFHLGGSWALTNNLAGDCNVVRCGKAIYGLADNDVLKPVLLLKTQIVQIKKINKGAKVGYGETFIAPKDMTIGILPIGYYDGVDRRLSNKGVVKLAGEKRPVFCKILGMISMNVTTIDLSEVENPALSMEVIIFSDSINDPNSLEQAGKLCNTIPLELVVHLQSSIRREII